MIARKWKIRHALLASALLSVIMYACDQQRSLELRLTNLAHLNHLYEEVTIDAQPMAIIHIYSEYPEYKWVDASHEGIACVDDAARAAVVYLRHFEITGDTMSLHRGRQLLEFCRYMQAEDGLFYNFILADHSINRDGKTSYKSLGWWTARALWAMGEGYRIFRLREPDYAMLLQNHIQKTFPHIDTLLAHFPRMDTANGFLMPRWLLHNSAADATSELMVGLARYMAVSNDQRVHEYLRKFSRGLVAMQLGDAKNYPYGVFLSWQNIWHGWGNGQTQALTLVAQLLNDEKILEAAETEVKFFYPYWQTHGWLREIAFVHDNGFRAAHIDTFPQIAYALRPMIVGALQLAQITQNHHYAELAGELATWFFGNNPAHAPMYDPQTGRGYDGILSTTQINRNAGAESTIEAVYSILEVEANTAARKILYKRINGLLDK
ncbi:MAG: hypothetical protein ONB44_17790 [candidate division KSB1 bacterium]|nr:hypothetical protein [candidate division KSB1 bacterium]MDZ7313675.1 hypothetical protein [candidate division KSB1 bacterium]